MLIRVDPKTIPDEDLLSMLGHTVSEINRRVRHPDTPDHKASKLLTKAHQFIEDYMGQKEGGSAS